MDNIFQKTSMAELQAIANKIREVANTTGPLIFPSGIFAEPEYDYWAYINEANTVITEDDARNLLENYSYTLMDLYQVFDILVPIPDEIVVRVIKYQKGFIEALENYKNEILGRFYSGTSTDSDLNNAALPQLIGGGAYHNLTKLTVGNSGVAVGAVFNLPNLKNLIIKTEDYPNTKIRLKTLESLETITGQGEEDIISANFIENFQVIKTLPSNLDFSTYTKYDYNFIQIENVVSHAMNNSVTTMINCFNNCGFSNPIILSSSINIMKHCFNFPSGAALILRFTSTTVPYNIDFTTCFQYSSSIIKFQVPQDSLLAYQKAWRSSGIDIEPIPAGGGG